MMEENNMNNMNPNSSEINAMNDMNNDNINNDSQNNLMEEKDKKSEVSSNADLLRDKLAYNENVPNININAGNSE